MNKIILCEVCREAKDQESFCPKCTFYIQQYCNNCIEKSAYTCAKCKEARNFLESDDKRQASAERTDRNHIIHISLEYAEGKKMLKNRKSNALDKLIESNDRKKILQAFSCLTETQKRRFIAHCIDGMTYREIAAKEGVNHTKIQKSVEQARKKIKNFFK
ncbi:sigma factor-like helix-turn-helix DNA-binding protein [Maledivibacter halophilus]|uniref:RNA polymerase sigma factor, sigma-70 family n=1 Tax=Maledivibacter halophilus TaxID=36842 RepID=A0A1T5LN94_9FIRM|nr:sigma factor-like helix-turn-helix DNA-binding protein [Maledivibacter halophilus]SKC77483.1 RNA polymerase sigma factor, sigma-70 family [Maledivibacter halophilus]